VVKYFDPESSRNLMASSYFSIGSMGYRNYYDINRKIYSCKEIYTLRISKKRLWPHRYVVNYATKFRKEKAQITYPIW